MVYADFKIKVDFGDGPQDVLVPNGCLGYSDQFLDQHAEVIINKHCSPWREYANFFMGRDYAVTLESFDEIIMKGVPIVESK
jgi:hypothetical protein